MGISSVTTEQGSPSRKCRMPPITYMMGTDMGDVVNLKRFKKRAEKQASAKQADANRA